MTVVRKISGSRRHFLCGVDHEEGRGAQNVVAEWRLVVRDR